MKLNNIFYYVVTAIVFCYIVTLTFAQGSDKLYDYKIISVIDGDTVRIEALWLPDELGKTIDIRLFGVDTPEHGWRAQCKQESALSYAATEFVKNQINKTKIAKVKLIGWDKYGGRILGDLILDGKSLSDILVNEGYGVKYYGDKKNFDWCRDKVK